MFRSPIYYAARTASNRVDAIIHPSFQYFIDELGRMPFVVELQDWKYHVIYYPRPMDHHDSRYPWALEWIGIVRPSDKELVDYTMFITGGWLEDANGILYKYLVDKITASYYNEEGKFQMPASHSKLYDPAEDILRIERYLKEWLPEERAATE